MLLRLIALVGVALGFSTAEAALRIGVSHLDTQGQLVLQSVVHACLGHPPSSVDWVEIREIEPSIEPNDESRFRQVMEWENLDYSIAVSYRRASRTDPGWEQAGLRIQRAGGAVIRLLTSPYLLNVRSGSQRTSPTFAPHSAYLQPGFQAQYWPADGCQEMRLECLRNTLLVGLAQVHVRIVPNFPRRGITFYHLDPLLAQRPLWDAVVRLMAAPFDYQHIQIVAGIETRGLYFGPDIARILGATFVPVRKAGHLPPPTLSSRPFVKEYGGASTPEFLEISRMNAQNQNVLLVDDVLATGETLQSAAGLLRQTGAAQIFAVCVIELERLGGRARLNFPLHCVMQFF